MDNPTTTQAPATPAPATPALPLAHHDHPFWANFGHLAQILLQVAVTAAPVVGGALGNTTTGALVTGIGKAVGTTLGSLEDPRASE